MLVAGLLVAVGVALLVLGRGDEPPAGLPVVPTPPGADVESVPDPFAWDPERADEFARRAAAGNSHLLYTLSPGGAAASAARTARWRPAVERAAAEAGVNADTLEGLVFLESAGREDARAPGGLENAVGLTQILAETAQNLLGMRVDLDASARYTRRLARAERRGRERQAAALRRARQRVDERFDPDRALAGTARYLALARERFGREDLAFVSYHMGIGNLESVLRDYGGGDPSYAQLYFDSTPTHHAAAYRRLTGLGDDSSNYLWKIAAAREIMRLWREDRPQLERLAALHDHLPSAAEVLHPPDEADSGDVVPFPDDPAVTGVRVGAGEVRREALAMALYIGAQVRAISGQEPLTVGSGAGWAFDVRRRYRSRRQALAFQFVLDRLQSLNAIAWSREGDAIHIVVSRDAEVLLPLLDRVQ